MATFYHMPQVGYGDIWPTNDAERLYTIGLMLVGDVGFAMCNAHSRRRHNYRRRIASLGLSPIGSLCASHMSPR